MAGAGLALALALASAGCARLPPEVAAEVAAPDGVRPDHFALRPPDRPPTVPVAAREPGG